MVEIADRQAFENWLADKPREVAVLLAARSALRILPLWPLILPDVVDRHRADILLPQLRAGAVALFAGTWPNKATDEFKYAALAAAYAADANAAGLAPPDAGFAAAVGAARPAATAATAFAATAANLTNVFSAALAVSAATAAASAAAEPGDAVAIDKAAAAAAAIWSALSLDCTALDTAGQTGEAADWPSIVARLGRAPLWPAATLTLDPNAARGAPPDWVGETWPRLKSDLLAVEGEDWQVWTDWYQARLDGGPHDPDLEQARVLLPENLWKKGPAAVNAHIRGLIEAHAAEVDNPDLP